MSPSPTLATVGAVLSMNGDTATVVFTAAAVSGVRWTRVEVTAYGQRLVDSVRHADDPLVARTVRIPIHGAPPYTAPGPAEVRVTAADASGREASRTSIAYPYGGPSIGGLALGPDASPFLLPGDTVHVTIGASSPVPIRYVGWSAGPPVSLRDSVAVTDSVLEGGFAAAASFVVPMDSRWLTNELRAGYGPVLTLFARDAAGYEHGFERTDLRVVTGIRRSMRRVPLTAPVADVAYDARRALLYMSQPDSSRVAVLDTRTMSWRAPISLPLPPLGMDLTLGGDSLIVALQYAPGLAVVNLATQEVTSVALHFAQSESVTRWPAFVRVMANGKAYVNITFWGSGFGGELWEWDLATGEQRRRTDVGMVDGQLSEYVPLLRSGDRTKLLIPMGNGDPIFYQIVDVASNSVGEIVEMPGLSVPPIATDARGSFYVVGGGTWNPVTGARSLIGALEFGPVGQAPSAVALTPDGTTAYLGTDYGFATVHVAGDVLEERDLIPVAPTNLHFGLPRRLVALPDGSAMIVVLDDAVFGVALR